MQAQDARMEQLEMLLMQLYSEIEQIKDDLYKEEFPLGAVSDLSFSGRAWVCGVLFTDLNTSAAKPWVKVKVSVPSASEESGPAPSPLPADEEWYEKSKTAGDIHVTRF